MGSVVRIRTHAAGRHGKTLATTRVPPLDGAGVAPAQHATSAYAYAAVRVNEHLGVRARYGDMADLRTACEMLSE